MCNNCDSLLQFFYAIASTKSSNIIVLCLAEIMVSKNTPTYITEIVTFAMSDIIGDVFRIISVTDENEYARRIQVRNTLCPYRIERARFVCLFVCLFIPTSKFIITKLHCTTNLLTYILAWGC